jgi:hypothetical protein
VGRRGPERGATHPTIAVAREAHPLLPLPTVACNLPALPCAAIYCAGPGPFGVPQAPAPPAADPGARSGG